MRAFRPSRYLKLVFLACGVVLTVLSGSLPAAAAPNQGPNPADFTQSGRYGNSFPGVARNIDYVVATSASNTILQTTLKIYLPGPSGQIVIHNHNICYATFRVGGRNYDLLDDGVNSSGTLPAVSFSIAGGGLPQMGAFDGTAACDNKTLTFNVSGAALDPSTGMYAYPLVVTANPAPDRYMNSFWVTGPVGAIVSQDSSLSTSAFGMNQTSPLQGNNPSGTQFPPNPYVNYSNWSIKFAPDCSVTAPTVTRRIEIFDDDNRNNWAVQPRPFLVKLQESPRQAIPSWTDVPMNPGSPSFPDGFGGFAPGPTGLTEVYTTANARRIWMDYTFKRDMIYQWIVDSVYVDNTLQFKIPFDNVYYYVPCATGNFNLQPNVTANITSGGSPITGSFAEEGDSVTFTYSVNNTGSTASSSVTCNIYANSHSGYFAIPSPAESSGPSPPGAPSCPAAFSPGTTTLSPSETVNNLPANTSVCRSLYVNPSTPGGPPIGREACVYVTRKPYARTYGGDISAGGGLATSTGGSCTLNNGAAIIGWNRRSSTWAGAGVQFAAYAMSTIFDTATSLGNGAGSAPRPDGLSFANVGTSTATGDFGGNLGAVGCIPDYYSRRPATTTTPPTGSGAITAMTTGTYGTNSNEYFSGSGNIDPGERITVYVNGDAYINANITYTGTWTTDSIPSFRLIARGNIYIDRNVSRIDGLYVAQANGPSGGEIHTCANTSPTYAALPLTNIGTQCAGKLTVNGSLVARQIRLIRTIGTQRSATETETAAAGNMAEAFNYSPIMWIPQPDDEGGPRDYDAINSLPPVL